MSIADKVRHIYQRRPYPFGDDRALRQSSWNLALDWVETLGRGGASKSPPARVLVAGCGDGTEAFNLRRQIPRAKIVAVDFSARSIAIARRLQRRSHEMGDITFVTADIADRGLFARIGGEFDLITCHGVLSYVSRPERVLRNFARCLAPEGALYLGVNGCTHVSTRLRQALPSLGFTLDEFQDGPRTRGALRLCDGVLARIGLPAMAALPAGLLAGDVFGALNQSLSLSKWVSLGRRSGLSFRGNWASLNLFRNIGDDDSYPLLMPKSRAQVADFLERLAPSQFHRLLFSRVPESNPPWEDRSRLLDWHISRGCFYQVKFPKKGENVRDRLRVFTVKNPHLNLSLDWQMAEWEIELLRLADGRRSLAKLLSEIPLSVPFHELRKQLYLLYQLGIVNIRPPGTARSPSRSRAPKILP
jgi:SAM-dependent methyltransferase